MTFSEEIIKVLDSLLSKFGIAIDWTAQNIIPVLTDILKRISIFEISKNGVGMIVCLALFILSLILIKTLTKNIVLEDVDDDLLFIGYGTLIITAVITMIIFIVNVVDSLKWGIVPEYALIEKVNELIHTTV